MPHTFIDNRVRIICRNCLHTKLSPLLPSDPPGTRFVITAECEKCLCGDACMTYLDFEGDKIDTSNWDFNTGHPTIKRSE